MPRTIYEMPSFGAWVEEKAFPFGHGFKVRSTTDTIPSCWEVMKGDQVVTRLFKKSADVLYPIEGLYDAINIAATEFEREFANESDKFEITISCRYQKPDQKKGDRNAKNL